MDIDPSESCMVNDVSGQRRTNRCNGLGEKDCLSEKVTSSPHWQSNQAFHRIIIVELIPMMDGRITM